MGVSVLVAAGWWVATVALTPAADRPYVGGSQNNSILNLIFGYNGFGRLTGNESGSVGGGVVGAGSMWGPTGWTRLFNAEFGNMMSWLLPGALVMGAALLLADHPGPPHRPRAGRALAVGRLAREHRPRHQPWPRASSTRTTRWPWRHRSARWSASPPWVCGQRRDTWVGRIGLAAGLGATVVWSVVLLGRTSDWFPALRPFVAVVGFLGVVAILALPLLRAVPKVAVGLVAVARTRCRPGGSALLDRGHGGARRTAAPSRR